MLDEVERLVESGHERDGGPESRHVDRGAGRRKAASGRIAQGAPLLLQLDADPTADVRNLRHLSAVVLRGRLIEAGELARLRAFDDRAGAGETDAD